MVSTSLCPRTYYLDIQFPYLPIKFCENRLTVNLSITLSMSEIVPNLLSPVVFTVCLCSIRVIDNGWTASVLPHSWRKKVSASSPNPEVTLSLILLPNGPLQTLFLYKVIFID